MVVLLMMKRRRTVPAHAGQRCAAPRGLRKQSWKNRHRHQTDDRSREDAESELVVCTVKNRATVSKTLTAWDAADNASKHVPSVP